MVSTRSILFVESPHVVYAKNPQILQFFSRLVVHHKVESNLVNQMQRVIEKSPQRSSRPDADFLLSVLHQTGYLVRKDLKKAWNYCRRAATKGSFIAQMTLKEIIEKADQSNPFFQPSLDWFIQAEDCFVPEAWHHAALLLTLDSSRRAQNSDNIVSLYRRAADSGYLPAHNNLAMHLAARGNYLEAYNTLQVASDAGHDLSRFNMILMQFEGTAPVRNIAECVHELQRLSSRQFAPAQQKLAELYREGLCVPQDDEGAYRLYSLACAQGLMYSQFAVVQMHLESGGKVYDPQRAFFLCNRLAMDSYAPAQFLLGQLYNFGLGTKCNSAKAEFWYHLAASNHSVEGQNWLKQAAEFGRN